MTSNMRTKVNRCFQPSKFFPVSLYRFIEAVSTHMHSIENSSILPEAFSRVLDKHIANSF